jgi:two-component system, sensor histidine kinase and response regulator
MHPIYKNEEINILIVDDNTQNIQVIGKILWQQNYNVIFATSGDEALSVLKSDDAFDLILLDILMPKMNGFEVCSKIREQTSLANIPIIFLTAKADKESVVEGFRKGANDYVAKPFHEEELLMRVQTQLKLKKQNEKIELQNKGLEKIVAEKTRELQNAYDQLGKLEYAKNNFLTLISHELRTPLNIINGFIEILLDSASEPSQIESLYILKKTANRLVSLSKTALLITEIKSGSYYPEQSKVNLHAACEKAIDLLKTESDTETNFDYRIIGSKNEILINGDENLIVNTLKLIAENSLEATKGNCMITFRLSQSTGNTKIEITDNGPGFSGDDLSTLFEIFSKKGPDPNHKGFGLSLSAVKLSMELQDGTVETRNLPEGGACVTLTFGN